jgi:hypothetical protein
VCIYALPRHSHGSTSEPAVARNWVYFFTKILKHEIFMNNFFNQLRSSSWLVGWKFLVGCLIVIFLRLYFTGTFWSIILLMISIFLLIFAITLWLPVDGNGFRKVYLLAAIGIGFSVFPIFDGHSELIKLRYRLELEIRRKNFEVELASQPKNIDGKKSKTWQSWNGSNYQFFLYQEGNSPPIVPSLEDKYQCSEYGTRLTGNFFLLATNCG